MRVQSLLRPKMWDMALRGWEPVSQFSMYMHLISGGAPGVLVVVSGIPTVCCCGVKVDVSDTDGNGWNRADAKKGAKSGAETVRLCVFD